MSKVILVTGATGKQGGAVIKSLLSSPTKYNILAVTRDPSSSSAQKLAAKSPSVKPIKGDLNDVPSLFAAAKEVSSEPIWGVYSVQISQGKGASHEGEIRQGISLVDESIKNSVKHFVYSSVDRGGESKSWENETPIPHFQTKHKIEHHLRDNAGAMSWTILRPAAFMDNLTPEFQSKVFLAALTNKMGDKKLQWVATEDIGAFAAKSFDNPEEWNHKAISLAGDELNAAEVSRAIQNTTGTPFKATFSILGSALMWAMKEFDHMISWFAAEGYGADIQQLRKIHPGLKDMESWLKETSDFDTK
ncbi:NmrA family protein-like protein [Patellaria atrata CBS 101060]|uniref:NmrA family protein-like protein n=1 Tax=Patellaria atrata CBS 101060 TaxID=1346257 RepID=A0A9P4S8Z8_9PEZI|nr:NmrA family protein-like protein [Patellaria atrata CBS 101060]